MRRGAWIAVLVYTMVSGCGSDTNETTGAPAGPGTIAAPSLNATSVIGNDLVIEWSQEDGVTGYKVYYSTNADFAVEPLDTTASVLNTSTNSITIAGIDKADNHYFYIQGVNNEQIGDLSQKYVAFSFLSSVEDTPNAVRDHINGVQWKRCPEGQLWREADSECSGTALVIEPADALSTYSNPNSEGWSLPLFGNTSWDTNCSTTTDQGSALTNLLVCKNNDDLEIGSATFSQRFTNPYYKEACEAYLSEHMPTLLNQIGFTAKTPGSCSGAYVCTISLPGGTGCGYGYDLLDRSVILNRSE